MSHRTCSATALEVPNEPEALVINYYLKADGSAPANYAHRCVRQVVADDRSAKTGLNQAFILLAGGGGRGAGGQRGRGAAPGPGPLTVGTYSVTVEVAGETLKKPARVRDRIPQVP